MKRKIQYVFSVIIIVMLICQTAFNENLTFPLKADTTSSVKTYENLIKSDWKYVAEQVDDNEEKVNDTQFTIKPDNVSVKILTTGHQACWCDDEDPYDENIYVIKDYEGNDVLWGDDPWHLRVENQVNVASGKNYILSFTVDNKMCYGIGTGHKVTEPTEKSVTVKVDSEVEGDKTNEFLLETVTVPPNEIRTYTFNVPIRANYQLPTVRITLAFGAYYYSYTLTQMVDEGVITDEIAKKSISQFSYPTMESPRAHGTLTFSDIKFYNPDVKDKINKPGIPKIKSVSALKKSAKKINIVIKKMRKINGLQVKVYNSRKNAKADNNVLIKKLFKKSVTKLTITSRKLIKKKKIYLKVRAYTIVNNKKVYGKWSNVKKIQLKK